MTTRQAYRLDLRFAFERRLPAEPGQPHTVCSFSYPSVEFEEPITRAGFEQSSEPVRTRILTELDATLARAGLDPRAIDVVCCTGGTARLPAVEHALAERFGADKLNQFQHFHSVILGLGEHARSLLSV